MVPGIGTVANGISAAWYAAEGDYASAALSATSMIPGVGTVIKGSALALKAAPIALKVSSGLVKAAPKLTSTLAKTTSKAVPSLIKTTPNAVPAFFAGGKRTAGNAVKQADGINKSSFINVSRSTQRSDSLSNSLLKSADNATQRITILDAAKEGIGVPVQARQSWRQSEKLVESQLKDHNRQTSFLDGVVVPYGTKGSVRVDTITGKRIMSGDRVVSYSDAVSVEVKNYNITTSKGRSSLVSTIKRQFLERETHLPAGTIQNVVIDARGQGVDEKVLDMLAERVFNSTDGKMGITILK